MARRVRGGPDRGTVVTPAVVAQRSFTDHIEVLGVAKGRQSVTITSNTTELVTGVHFKDGEAVRKGQVLVDLKATEQDAGVIQSQAALDLAKLDCDRWQALADRGIAPKATADQYRIAYEQAKANLTAARSRRSDRVIRAPFSGVVGLSDIAPGALINPGAPVATLDDIAVIRVDFDIPDRYLPELKQGLSITARADAYPNETFQGVIAQLDTRIDEKTRAIKARAEFPNTGGRLKPGMLMRVSIDQGPAHGARGAGGGGAVQRRPGLRLCHHPQGAGRGGGAAAGDAGRRPGRLLRDQGRPGGRRGDRRRRGQPGLARPAGQGAGGGRPQCATPPPRPRRAPGRRRRRAVMMLSDIAVRRPVFAAVAAIILCVVGLAAFTALPVRELPAVDPPQVSIQTNYTGASAEVVEERITQIIEQQVAGIQGIDQETSSSRDGSSRINITFTLDRNLDAAANDVRDAVSRVLAKLPPQADAPQINKANADSSPIMFLRLSSTSLDELALADYANRFLVERLSTVPGVALVNLGGAKIYTMRIWLNASAMAARGVTVSDVITALNNENVELPAGALESSAKDFTIRVNRRYARPEDFATLPVVPPTQAATAGPTAASAVGATVTNPGGQTSQYITRLGDVAQIEEGPDDRRKMFHFNGLAQIGIALTRQSQANDLEISKGVHKMIEEVNAGLPKGTRLDVAVDYSVFTQEAIREVWITMAMSLFLVAMVNFVFLGSWRAAVIPAVVAPICILSAFIVLAPLGFSINLLTLLALVLSIGLVVDDAIVVVENVQRRVDGGEPPLVAAERGARQVFFAVVATTIVLISVFGPLMVLPGYIGHLFVELAVTVASAVFFSALLALSLSPMLGSKLLRPASGEGWLAIRVNRAMGALRESYRASLTLLLGSEAHADHRRRRRGDAGARGRRPLHPHAQGAGAAGRPRPHRLQHAGARGRGLRLHPRRDAEARADARQAARPGPGGPLHRRGAEVRPEPVQHRLRQRGAERLATPQGQRRQARRAAEPPAQRPHRGAHHRQRPRALPARRRCGGSGSNVDLIVEGDDYGQIARWIQPVLAASRAQPGPRRARGWTTSRPRRG